MRKANCKFLSRSFFEIVDIFVETTPCNNPRKSNFHAIFSFAS